ncbi:family 20 glycosylhydrolase [Lentisphaerota bacterium WC36G]|nr:beta-N-acetylhexosaminidase [Lentisphaerae bacterium WC36]
MKQFKKKIVLSGVVLSTMLALRANDNLKLGIVPQPNEVKLTADVGDIQKSFVMNKNNPTVIIYDIKQKELKNVAQYLKKFIENSPYDVKVIIFERGAGICKKWSDKTNFINLSIKPLCGCLRYPEQYHLSVNNNKAIEISAPSANGVFYGVQTLLQLMPTDIYKKSAEKVSKDIIINAVEIKDKPLFTKFRGLHVDFSRHFRTLEETKQIIDWMAMHKLNTLQMHLTDDQGWRIEIKKYPKLTTVGGIGDNSHKHKGEAKFFTQEQLKEIIAYAKSRYIKIIPEIDIPGHMEAAIRAYPELASPSDLRATKKVIRIDDKGFEFVKDVLTEVDELFSPEYIHVGFDEINLGSKKPIYDNKQITEFGRKVTNFIKNDLKKTPIVWDDAFEKGLDNDKEILVHWWRTGKNHWWRKMEMTIDQKLQKYNQPYINSNAAFIYFDMKNVKEDKRGAGWAKPISVAEIYNHDIFADLKDYDVKKRILAQGTIAATWSESIDTMAEFEKRVFPRLAAFSENAWALPKSMAKGNKPTWIQYRDNILIPKQLERYKAMNLRYWGDAQKITELKSLKKYNK